MQLNADDGGKRQFIMCTCTDNFLLCNSDWYRSTNKGGIPHTMLGYRSIDEISRERIVRAAKKIQEEKAITTK